MQGKMTFSVSQLNEYVKMTLESAPVLRDVYLKGEISNFKSNYSSGHLYFSLKDESSSIKAVMFRSYASRLKFRAESGMKVVVHGRISAYTVSGDYQIVIDDMQPDGVGALALAFEQLKRRLESEGLFAPEKKLPIPSFVRSVGVITSASGAALHDIINVSGRRCPSCEIVIYPAYVQGELAPQSLIGGVRFFNNRHPVDLIIIGRGGGSAEDLWAFNDESLARAIAESSIPIISAVGHETDFTICDFVSDMRAPTPSAAAELAFPDTAEIKTRIASLMNRAESSLTRKMYLLESRLDVLRQANEANSPINRLDRQFLHLERLRERLDTLADGAYTNAYNSFKMLCVRLESVNPLSVLSHGYAVVENGKGEILSSASDVEMGECVKVGFADGYIKANVTDIKINNEKAGQ